MNLRFIERDGQKILQHKIETLSQYNGLLIKWADVPFVRAEPETVTVTREQFDKAWDSKIGAGCRGTWHYREFCKALGFKDD